MKIAKALFNIIFGALTAYLFVFLFWFILFAGCVQYVGQHELAPSECRENLLTKVVLKTHAPLISFIFGANR